MLAYAKEHASITIDCIIQPAIESLLKNNHITHLRKEPLLTLDKIFNNENVILAIKNIFHDFKYYEKRPTMEEHGRMLMNAGKYNRNTTLNIQVLDNLLKPIVINNYPIIIEDVAILLTSNFARELLFLAVHYTCRPGDPRTRLSNIIKTMKFQLINILSYHNNNKRPQMMKGNENGSYYLDYMWDFFVLMMYITASLIMS